MISVVGQLAADGAIEVVDVDIDLRGPWKQRVRASIGPRWTRSPAPRAVAQEVHFDEVVAEEAVTPWIVTLLATAHHVHRPSRGSA